MRIIGRLWDRGENRAGLVAAGIAAAVLLFGVALFMSVLASGVATAGVRWTRWVASGGYLPWNVAAVFGANPKALFVVLAGALAVGGYVRKLAREMFAGPLAGGPPTAGRGEYGTARWRAEHELRQGLSVWDPRGQVSGIVVGQSGGRPWISSMVEHILLLGSTGSGKSRRVILPTIGVIGSTRRESVIVTDPKGELYAHTAAWLRNQGYRVVLLDLRTPSRGSRWNPMGPVVDALARGRMDQASAAARDIGHAFAVGDEGAAKLEALWAQSTEALISALVLAVATGCPPNGDPAIPWPSPAERTIASVYQSVLTSGENGKLLDTWMSMFPDSHPASRAYGPVRLAVEKTRASILTVAATALSPFGDSDVAWLTSATDLDLAEPGRRPTAVFLVIPDERSTRYPLATLYLQQTLQALAALADEHGGSLPVRVNLLLDEFANLPALKDFDKTVTVARGRNIRLLLAIQDLAQLAARYGPAAGTIKGNCSWLYLLTNDLGTANEIAGKLGNYTTEPLSPHGTGLLGGGAQNAHPSLMGRSLLYADEIMRWPEGEALYLQARHSPARMRLPDLSAWKSLFPEIMDRSPMPPAQATPDVPVWGFGKLLSAEGMPPDAEFDDIVDGQG